MLFVNDEVLSPRKVEQLHGARFTYSAVGSTQSDILPSGYATLRRARRIGSGRERFEEATRVLLSWDMHRRAGLRVRASSQRVVSGAVAVLRLGVGPLGIPAPVRVVYVMDEPCRKGFAYGTLPGHPESGEEAFVVELQKNGDVTFTITAFSCPQTFLARVGGPIARAVQSRVTNRYLRSV